MNEQEDNTDITDLKEWKKAIPEELPPPAYWPFFLAMGFAFMMWGMLTGWIIEIGGVLITITALYGWIQVLRNEARGRK